jgi:DNA-binding SARP family transcriptional activator/TolB-like protein
MAFVLQLLGGFRLIGEDGKVIPLPDRARALLAYLAVASSPVPRQALAALLSAEGNEQEQRTALRQAVYLARKATADNAVTCKHESDLALNGALVSADVDPFRSAIARGDRGSLAEAVELYRGPFLEGERSPSPAFEEWLAARRAEFLDHALEAGLTLAGSEAAAGLHGSALAHARRALTLDPLREDAHRQVMRSLAAMGQRSNALRQYDVARQMLAEELGVAPENETKALREAIARGEEGPKDVAEPMAAHRIAADGTAGRARRRLGRLRGSRMAMAAAAAILLIVVGGTAVGYFYPRPPPPSDLPSIAVLPFTNTSGDASQDYLGNGIVDEITTMLSTHPSVRVVSRATRSSGDRTVRQVAQQLGARYLLEGSVRKSADKTHVTAQLIEAATGDHLWARRFEEQGDDLAAIQGRIANRIYESLVGFTGEIDSQEQRRAWRRSASSLEEHDYFMRGQTFYFQFTRDAHARARQIWQEGLAKFPDSIRLRIGLAAGHRHGVEVGWSEHPEQDLDRAWQLAGEAALADDKSRLELWLSRWAMAKVAQWCKEDYERSVAEAEATIKLVPYDATSRADLAELMANAGKTDEAIEWLREAVRRDPDGPEWYRGNLAWAYYLAGRHEDALAELQKLRKPRRLLLAAVHVRLGHVEDARDAVTEFSKENPGHTLADEARKPLIGSLERIWLADLRTAGLPD